VSCVQQLPQDLKLAKPCEVTPFRSSTFDPRRYPQVLRGDIGGLSKFGSDNNPMYTGVPHITQLYPCVLPRCCPLVNHYSCMNIQEMGFSRCNPHSAGHTFPRLSCCASPLPFAAVRLVSHSRHQGQRGHRDHMASWCQKARAIVGMRVAGCLLLGLSASPTLRRHNLHVGMYNSQFLR
jgi:hypothetical protein